MSDFLHHLAARSLGSSSSLRPRLASLFEPPISTVGPSGRITEGREGDPASFSKTASADEAEAGPGERVIASPRHSFRANQAKQTVHRSTAEQARDKEESAPDKSRTGSAEGDESRNLSSSHVLAPQPQARKDFAPSIPNRPAKVVETANHAAPHPVAQLITPNLQPRAEGASKPSKTVVESQSSSLPAKPQTATLPTQAQPLPMQLESSRPHPLESRGELVAKPELAARSLVPPMPNGIPDREESRTPTQETSHRPAFNQSHDRPHQHQGRTCGRPQATTLPKPATAIGLDEYLRRSARRDVQWQPCRRCCRDHDAAVDSDDRRYRGPKSLRRDGYAFAAG